MSNISVQIFAKYIIEKLRKANPHLKFSVDESTNVLGGAVVHIPNAGASPTVVKNRSSFPATAVQRTDSFVTYALDVFTTTPTFVTWQEENEISYEKTDSVLNDHVQTLLEAVGDDVLYKWVTGIKADGTADSIPAANIIKTSGAAVAVTETGQSGQRKAFTYADLAKAQSRMNKMNVPKDGRYALLESYQYQQLIDSLSTNQMAAFQQTADLENGIVGKLAGFNILERSTVLAFNGNTPIAPGTALIATSNVAALCWQKDSVALALGDIKPFQDDNNPSYYGDIFSAAVKAGGRCRRQDWAGFIAIVQDAIEPAPTISDDDSVELLATATPKNRTYATSNGADVTASTEAEWLTVSANGKKVTFTPQAYAYDAEGEATRTATVIVGIAGTDVTKEVTVTQPMAENN